MSLIIEGLYLGSAQDANNLAFLQSNRITSILIVARELVEFQASGFTYLKIPAHDHPSFSLKTYFEEMNSFIESGLSRGGVLVHCMLGISRSATAVIAYLMASRGWTPNRALQFVRSRRKVEPNDGFLQQLAAFHRELRGLPPAPGRPEASKSAEKPGPSGVSSSPTGRKAPRGPLNQPSPLKRTGRSARQINPRLVIPPTNVTPLKRLLPQDKTPLKLKATQSKDRSTASGLLKNLRSKFSTLDASPGARRTSAVSTNALSVPPTHSLVKPKAQAPTPRLKSGYLCAHCEAPVFAAKHLITHEAEPEKCLFYFVERAAGLKVMVGRLLCPECSAILGESRFGGSLCSCGLMVADALRVNKKAILAQES